MCERLQSHAVRLPKAGATESSLAKALAHLKRDQNLLVIDELGLLVFFESSDRKRLHVFLFDAMPSSPEAQAQAQAVYHERRGQPDRGVHGLGLVQLRSRSCIPSKRE